MNSENTTNQRIEMPDHVKAQIAKQQKAELRKFAINAVQGLQAANISYANNVTQPNEQIKSAQQLIADAEIIYQFLIKE